MWNEKKLAGLAAQILKNLHVRGGALDIFLLPNKEMKELKLRHIRDKKVRHSEPNVLAFAEPIHFPHPELPRKKKYLGEIFLNKDILKKSPERAEPLLVHGILHLMGHDHEKNDDAKKMESLERKILSLRGGFKGHLPH